jgi:hypothetical protein
MLVPKLKKQPDQPADEITITVPSYSYSDSGSLMYGVNGISAQDIMSSVTIPAYTIGSGTTITNGSTYTTSAIGASWSQDYSFNNVTSSNVHISGNGITMEPEADIKIGDRSLKEFMNAVEEQLAILRPAPELETKWNQLKDLRQQYEAVKADILEKEKMWNILKKA